MSTTMTIDGDLDRTRAEAATEAIDAVTDGPLTLQLDAAEIADGPACAILASAVRRAAERLGDVVLVEPPQVLAHTLYRVGALERGAIRLVDPRDELGTAS